jgi:hypothetical protein
LIEKVYMAKIRKVKVFSFAKFQAVLFALMGSVLGIIYSFGGLLVDILVSLGWVSTSETPGLSFGTLLAFFALIAMPLIAALIGFVLGVIEALLFNFVVSRFGGMHLESE